MSEILNLKPCLPAGRSKISIYIIVALILRLFIAWFQYSGDLGNHLAWGQFILHSPQGLYQHDFSPISVANYPPVAMFIFAACVWLYHSCAASVIYLNSVFDFFPSFLVPFVLDNHMLMLFLKLPAIIADIAIGAIIYRHRHLLSVDHRLSTIIYLFNPATIYLSSVWGQIEPVTGLLVLLSVITPSVIPSVIFFTLAALTKQTALWLAPMFIVFSLKRSIPSTFVAGILAIIIFTVSYQPFLLSPSFIAPITMYLSTLQGSSQVIADQAWNLWSLFLPASSADGSILLGTPVRILSLLSLVASYLLVTLYQLKRTREVPFTALFLISLAAFFLQTRVHERHLYPALLFCLFLPWPKKIVLPLYILISVFFMANLYWSLKLPFI